MPKKKKINRLLEMGLKMKGTRTPKFSSVGSWPWMIFNRPEDYWYGGGGRGGKQVEKLEHSYARFFPET